MRDTDPVEISEKNGVRLLHLGGEAVQSAMRLRAPFALELEYTRAMLAFLLFVPQPHEIALVGLGGGSIAKFIHRNLPETRLTAVEIHPGVVDAAYGYFFLPPNDARLTVRVGDGGEFVRTQAASLDVLLVDGYDARRIVEALASPGFYAACHAALRPGGVAVFNLWGGDRFFETYRERIAAAFVGQTLNLPAEKRGNIQVLAFRAPVPALTREALGERARQIETGLGLEMPRFLDRLLSVNPDAALLRG
jgi:spermidine synthase